MIKTFKICISIILCLAMVLSLASCDLISEIRRELFGYPSVKPGQFTGHSPVPEGYTGGLQSNVNFHSDYGIHWLETYEEVLAAVELLKAHGSIIKPAVGVDIEEVFDVKWCFIYQRNMAEQLVEGANFFDRKIDNGSFVCYIFRMDVTIDELIYSNVFHYQSIKIYTKNYVRVENIDELSIYWWDKELGYDKPFPGEDYLIAYNDKVIAGIETPSEYHPPIDDELLDAIIKSVVFVD